MGSGKGRTRRAQATSFAKQGQEVTWDVDKWNEFVDGETMKNVMVDEYYLSKGAMESALENYGLVFSELFADAVAVGAIVLPDGVNVDDFRFVVGPFSNEPRHGRADVYIFKGDTEEGVGLATNIDETDMMSSEYVSAQLVFIVRRVHKLLFG